jgi:hypothetical protein
MHKIEAQKKVLETFKSKAVITNARGDMSIDGVPLLAGIDGRRAMGILIAGFGLDVDRLGADGTVNLYQMLSRFPRLLGWEVERAIRLSRRLDADTIAGK